MGISSKPFENTVTTSLNAFPTFNAQVIIDFYLDNHILSILEKKSKG